MRLLVTGGRTGQLGRDGDPRRLCRAVVAGTSLILGDDRSTSGSCTHSSRAPAERCSTTNNVARPRGRPWGGAQPTSRLEFGRLIARRDGLVDVWARREIKRLPTQATWFCSPETEAQQTAQLVSDDDVVLVGHGTAWTLLVAELTGREPDLGRWRSLGMPDVIEVASRLR